MAFWHSNATLNVRPLARSCWALLSLHSTLTNATVHVVLQFNRADYEADMASLADMTHDEVVAMLWRNSLSFSRCTHPCFCQRTPEL